MSQREISTKVAISPNDSPSGQSHARPTFLPSGTKNQGNCEGFCLIWFIQGSTDKQCPGHSEGPVPPSCTYHHRMTGRVVSGLMLISDRRRERIPWGYGLRTVRPRLRDLTAAAVPGIQGPHYATLTLGLISRLRLPGGPRDSSGGEASGVLRSSPTSQRAARAYIDVLQRIVLHTTPFPSPRTAVLDTASGSSKEFPLDSLTSGTSS